MVGDLLALRITALEAQLDVLRGDLVDALLALRDMTPMRVPHLGLCEGPACGACARTMRAREVLARHAHLVR